MVYVVVCYGRYNIVKQWPIGAVWKLTLAYMFWAKDSKENPEINFIRHFAYLI